MSPSERREMVRDGHTGLSLTRQCKLLQISRSSLYYTPVGIDAATLELMNEIDRVFTKYPFFGSRQIAAYLPRNGFHAGRHRVRRLMGIMGLQAIYKGPNTSKKHPQHPIYPYLLRKLPITRPNHVWCSDITYVRRQSFWVQERFNLSACLAHLVGFIMLRTCGAASGAFRVFSVLSFLVCLEWLVHDRSIHQTV